MAWRFGFFRQQARVFRASVASHRVQDTHDEFAPTHRVKAASSARKAVDITRARLLFVMCVFGFGFTGVGVRVLEIGLRGSLVTSAEASTTQPGESLLTDDDPTPEPGVMDALLGHEQAVPAEEARATVEQTAEAARPKRADITDRNGIMLATSVDTQSLYADGKVIRQGNVAATVEKLVALFPEFNREQLQRKLEKGGRFTYLKRHLTPQEQDGVLALGIPGLSFQPDSRRVYPQSALAAHVLGYVDIDNKGISGVEKAMEKRLTDPEQNHQPLALSIDLRVQNILRSEMLKAVADFQAIGAAGVVMDIHTGEIIAMSSLPDFDPNMPGRMSDDAKFNRVSLGVYEMGSTFKTFTTAMALNYGTVGLEGGYDASQPIHVGRFTIKDAHPENRWLSVPEIYAYSSNIGSVHIIEDVGVARQKAFLTALGLTKPVTIELPERGWPIYPKDWREVNMMTIAYGHGMSVTPLHLVRAIGAIVGDGKLHQLSLIKGGKPQKDDGKPIVSEKTSYAMRQLMRLVVEYGTASRANAPGYEVGGKTGTAEKVQGGRYAHNDKMASFVGIFPVSNPQYVVLVMMDTPRGNKSTYGFATGGWVSAPVVGKVVSRMGPLLGMKPQMEASAAPVPTWLQHARAKLAKPGHE